MIKYLDLERINTSFEPQLSLAVDKVVKSGWYLFGEEVNRFEERFPTYCGIKHCVGVGNGLDALTLIFMAYISLGKMKRGDEVIVPANTYIASILAVLRAGLKPVFCEPEWETILILLKLKICFLSVQKPLWWFISMDVCVKWLKFKI